MEHLPELHDRYMKNIQVCCKCTRIPPASYKELVRDAASKVEAANICSKNEPFVTNSVSS